MPMTMLSSSGGGTWIPPGLSGKALLAGDDLTKATSDRGSSCGGGDGERVVDCSGASADLFVVVVLVEGYWHMMMVLPGGRS